MYIRLLLIQPASNIKNRHVAILLEYKEVFVPRMSTTLQLVTEAAAGACGGGGGCCCCGCIYHPFSGLPRTEWCRVLVNLADT